MEIHEKIGSVEITLDTSRIDGNLREAQKELNKQVVDDCDPLVPYREGSGVHLRDSVRYPEGAYGGEIMYDTPYAHALYVGRVFTPNIPIKDAAGNITGWFSPPGKKKQITERKMKFHTAGTTDHWFEEAKRLHKQEWIKLVKETAGKK